MYFWNKEDTNTLHNGEQGFTENSVPQKANIQNRQVGGSMVEFSDILYGHKQYNLGNLANALDYEYEFYNHLPATGMKQGDYVTEDGVTYLTPDL